MSLYVRWVNLIKEKADASWLTDSQRAVYERLLSSWQSQPFVNLYGPSGSGKSFLARILARYHAYAYVQQLEEAPHGAAQVVFDDAEYSRMLRPAARSLALGRVILVTQHAIGEAMPKAELKLSMHDVRQFCATLSDRCGITFIQTIPESEDLGEVLRQEVIARGEAHVHR